MSGVQNMRPLKARMRPTTSSQKGLILAQRCDCQTCSVSQKYVQNAFPGHIGDARPSQSLG